MALPYDAAYLEAGCDSNVVPFAEVERDTLPSTWATNYAIGLAALACVAAMAIRWRCSRSDLASVLVTFFFIFTALGYSFSGLYYQFESTDRIVHSLGVALVVLAATGLNGLAILLFRGSQKMNKFDLCGWLTVNGVVLLVFFLSEELVAGFWILISNLITMSAFGWRRPNGFLGKLFALGVYSFGLLVWVSLENKCGVVAYEECFKDCPLPNPDVFNNNALMHVFVFVAVVWFGWEEVLRPTTTHKDTDDKESVLQRLVLEFSLPMFDLEDGDKGRIDPEASFCSKKTALHKIVCTILALLICLHDVFFPYPLHVWLFISNWSAFLSALYLLLSAIASLRFQPAEDEGGTASLNVKVLWALFSVAATSQGFICFGYWTNPDFGDGSVVTVVRRIAVHGGGFAVLCVEGFVLNKVPVRIKHIVFVYVLFAVYLIWTIIHAFTNIGNPHGIDGTLLYENLDWRGRPGMTTGYLVLSWLVLTPMLHWLLWIASLPNRRYVITVERSEDESNPM